jgi:hypothetical protein
MTTKTSTMSRRNAGVTRTCAGCRYWGEKQAFYRNGQIVRARCLQAGGPPLPLLFQPPQCSCDLWGSGHFGPVDMPGNADLYFEEEILLIDEHPK